MVNRILVTGGAGFIGTRLVQRLLADGRHVTILDNFSQQIHATDALANLLEYYSPFESRVRVVQGDVRDAKILRSALSDADSIVHLAAETGTGQSMYEVSRYVDVNVTGTAVVLEEMIRFSGQIRKAVVASSRAVYGEGIYESAPGVRFLPQQRSEAQLSHGVFDVLVPGTNLSAKVVPTPEDIALKPVSVYGITKATQEALFLQCCSANAIDAVALRFQNVFGPGQSLKNPYTGIISIFSNILRLGEGVRLFEDGVGTRDFVYIDDVVNSIVLSLNGTSTGTFNIGSGVRTTIKQVAEVLARQLNSSSQITVTGEYRVGDVRHCVADLAAAKKTLGYSPSVDLEQGLTSFLEWAQGFEAKECGYVRSLDEMVAQKLLRKALNEQ